MGKLCHHFSLDLVGLPPISGAVVSLLTFRPLASSAGIASSP